MEKNLVNELNQMKSLFVYKAGKVISEQVKVDEDYEDIMMGEKEVETPVRPTTKPGVKPGPKTPYKPKPGVKPNPKAEKKSNIPDWLTFDELGLTFDEE
jgi:hypothetical protein